MIDTLVLLDGTLLPGNALPPDGSSPHAVAYDAANGDVYVPTSDSNSVTVINGATNAILALISVGAWPDSVTYDSDNGYVYVTNYNSDNVTVINSTTDVVVGSVSVGAGPDSVTYDSGNGFVYVANYGSDNVTVVNGTTDMVAGWVPVGSNPSASDYDVANGYVYVADYGSGNVTVINGTTDSIVGSVPVGSDPGGVGYDPANGCIYVANGNSGNVSVINGTTDSVVWSVWIGGWPISVAYDSANGDVLVPNYDAELVTVINGTTNTISEAILLAGAPYAVTYDVANGYGYVAEGDIGTVEAISVATDSVVASVPVGSHPNAVGYDSGDGYVYVADRAFDNVSVFNGTTGSVLGSVPVGNDPDAIAYDAANGNVYVANYLSNNVTVINGTTGSIVASIPVGSYPDAVGYDSANGFVYVANFESFNVSVINGSTQSVVGSIPVGLYPDAVACDNASGYVFVANLGSDNVSVINSTTDSVVTSLWGYSEPIAEAYDSANGYVYLAVEGSDSVSVINGTTAATLGSVEVGQEPYAVTYDSVNGYICVANLDSNNVTVINGTTDTVFGSISVGSHPHAAASSSANGFVYVANYDSGTVSIIRLNATFPVTFVESGLPSGTYWSVTLSGSAMSSNGTAISFPMSNGTYTFAITNASSGAALFAPIPAFGSGTIDGAGATINVTFAQVPFYGVTFNETGLPNGTFWSVEFYDSTTSYTVNSSTNGTVGFAVPNGTCDFWIWNSTNGSALYVPTPAMGNFSVNGTNVTVDVAFAYVPFYNLSFNETGLPNGTYWALEIYNNSTGWLDNWSTNSTIGFVVPNGTYYFDIWNESNGSTIYVPVPTSGNISVSGANVTVNVTFEGITYCSECNLTFNETGLPNGTYWDAQIYSASTHWLFNGSTNSTIGFTVPNGSYQVYVWNITNGTTLYVATPHYEIVTVNGANVTVDVTFVPTPLYSVDGNETGLPPGTSWSAELQNVSIGGFYNLSTSSTVGFLVPNGTYYFHIWNVTTGGQVYVPAPASGYITVNGFNFSGAITFTPVTIVVAPGQGPVGATVTVTGSDFSGSTPLASLVLDGVSITSCTSGSLTTNATGAFSCTFLVPGGTSGTTVTATDVGGAYATGRFLVTTPSLTVYPGQGPVGAAVTVSGTGFTVYTPLGSLTLDGIPITSCVSGSLTTGSPRPGAFHCTFLVPDVPSGARVPLIATDVTGTNASQMFWVTTPKVTISPGQGPVGATVTIAGVGFSVFTPLGTLTLGGVPISICVSGSLTTGSPYPGGFHCTFVVPSVTPGSRYPLVATDVGGTNATTTLWVTEPSIAVYPGQGPVGATVTVTGVGFSVYTPLGSLTLDGVPITSCTAGSLTTGTPYAGAFRCTFVVPTVTPGSRVPVTATDEGGATATFSFWVTTPRIVITPGSGPEGATVTVTGVGFSVFTPLASLVFDGVSITTCLSGSLTTGSPYPGAFSCTFLVPSGTSGTTVTATDAGGTVATTEFTVTS